MFKPIYFALFVLTVLVGFYGTALAQAVPPDVAAAQVPAQVQQPQQPPVTTAPARTTPGYVAPVPFGALYNTLSGAQPPARGQQQPLTPFNTP